MKANELDMLQRELTALSYHEPLDAASAPLAQRLLDDLTHTTESYRQLKLQLNARGQEVGIYHSKVEVMKREAGRLAGENNSLHLQLMELTEEREALELQHKRRVKDLQGQLSDLNIYKTASNKQLHALEREISELKRRLETHAGKEDTILPPVSESFSDTDKVLEGTAPAEPQASPSANYALTAEQIDILKATNKRNAALEASICTQVKELEDASDRIADLEAALVRRDAEIARLGGVLEAGAHIDVNGLAFRNEINENIILQLNEQVEMYTARFAEVQDVVSKAGKLQHQMQIALQRQQEAVERNKVLQQEVVDLKAELLRAQAERVGAGGAKAADAVLVKVMELKQDLESTDRGCATLRSLVQAANRERLTQTTRERALQAEVKSLRGELEDIKAAKEQLQLKYISKENRRPPRQGTAPAKTKPLADADALAADLQKRTEELAAVKAELDAVHAKVGPESSHNASASTEAQPVNAAVASAADPASREALHRQLVQLQAQVVDCTAQLSHARELAAQYQKESVSCRGDLRTVQKDMTSLRRALETAEAHRDHVQQELAATVQCCSRSAASIKALEEQAAQGDFANMVAELKHLGELLSAAQDSVPDTASLATGAAQRILALQRQLALKEEELQGERAQAETAQWAFEGARKREEQSNSHARQQSERAHRAEQLAERLRADMESIRSEQDAERAKTRALAGQLEAAHRDVEQLQSLTLRGDTTVQELVAQLKAVTAKLHAAEEEAARFAAEGHAAAKALEEQQKVLQDAHKAIEDLSGHRDALSNELSSGAEHISRLAADYKNAQAQISNMSRYVADLEGQVAQSDTQLQERGSELNTLRTQHQALQDECHALHEELDAVSDDLTVLVRENQAISNELMMLNDERDQCQVDLEAARQHVTNLQRMTLSKESDIDSLRLAYEALAAEKQDQKDAVDTLQRELAAKEAQLAGQTAEYSSLQEAYTKAQAQLHQSVLDIQAHERQIDSLQRQLKRAGTVSQELDKERQTLQERLTAAELVHCEGERQREGLQRQVATLDSQVLLAQARSEETAAENQMLQRRLDMQQRRVTELEGLLAQLRESHFHAESRPASPNSDQTSHQAQDAQTGARKMDLHARARDRSLAEINAQLLEAQQENERMMDLVARLDNERNELEQDNAKLRAQILADDSPQQSSEEATPFVYRPGDSAAIDELNALKAELERERLERNQAERDFEELMETVGDLRA